MSSTLFNKLADAWLNKLSASGSNGPANVLWACGNLGSAGHPVWSRTWQAFLKLITKDLLGGQPPNVRPQEPLNVLYACAKLRQQPRPEELLLLVGSFVHPAVISEARPQDLAKVILSMGGLSANHGLSEEVSQEVLQRLLDKQVLAKVIGEGSSQNNAKVLLGLGRMCTGPSPLLVSTAVAQGYAVKLLAGVQLDSMCRGTG
jgi:hypothetical protein